MCWQRRAVARSPANTHFGRDAQEMGGFCSSAAVALAKEATAQGKGEAGRGKAGSWAAPAVRPIVWQAWQTWQLLQPPS